MVTATLYTSGGDLTSTIGVLAEDARIRAMVLTPFDQATMIDLLTDLKATSGASVLAMLDSAGTVRAVVGAPEMEQLDLGTSSLVQAALVKPSARLWVFANRVGVLSATPVRLDSQVRALFMMGFEIDDALLKEIERSFGSTGAVFVGDTIAASATKDPEIVAALRAAVELPPGTYHDVAGRFLAMNSRMSDSAVAATVAWLVPLHRHTDEATLTRALSWLPAVLVGLVLMFMIGLVRSQQRAGNL
ncbi:MAG: cache domain-containing protein [Deltaproteobacteria bacterium]